MSQRYRFFETLKFYAIFLGAVSLILLILFIGSCDGKNKTSLNTVYLSTTNVLDNIMVTDIGTGFEMANLFGNTKIEFPIPYNRISKVSLAENNSSYLAFLEAGEHIEINVLPDSSITTKRTVDSLLNYLSSNTLDYANENLDFIFNNGNFDSIVDMFNSYKLQRERQILDFSSRLTNSELEVLKFYNSARLYGFLLYFGLAMKKIEMKSSFYDFAEEIDLSDNFIKSAPNLLLNKLKIQFLRKKGSLDTLNEFLDYIEENINNRDTSDFMKSMFIKELLESSLCWENELELLNTAALKTILEEERENKYYHIMKKVSGKFLLTQKGKEAFNFKAERPDGTTFTLGDLRGKTVLIDVWATWCAPCLQSRPKVVNIANKFKDNPNFEVLFVSVDDSREKWLDYLKDNAEPSISNVFIQGGMKKGFGRQFNINYIPNYMLLDKQGLIVDAYIKEPDESVEKMIAKELSK